jgi:hypothetical protein
LIIPRIELFFIPYFINIEEGEAWYCSSKKLLFIRKTLNFAAEPICKNTAK